MDETWSTSSLAVLKDPDNLAKWETLILSSQRLNGGLCKASLALDKKLFRSAYDRFLLKFPLLHQHWLTYATHEFTLGHTDRAEAVYVQALRAMPYSIDVWLGYLRFRMTVDPAYEPTLVLFEKARVRVGYHYFGHEFYDLYLEFLLAFDRAAERVWLLRRVIEVPLYHYGKYFAEFFKLIESIPTHPEIATWLIPEASALKFNLDNHHETAAKLKKTFTDVYIATQYEVFEMWRYEREIKRHYFHVTYLTTTELEHWELYLNYIELKGDRYRTTLTYERCLTATAMYDKFWLRYASYQAKDPESSKETLRRGLYHVPMARNGLALRLWEFEMADGNYLRARDMVVQNLRLAPTLIQWYVALLHLEWALKHDVDHLVALVEIKALDPMFDVLFDEVARYNPPELLYERYTHKTSLWYWQSYALALIRTGKLQAALRVVQRGLEAIPASDQAALLEVWKTHLQPESGLEAFRMAYLASLKV